MTKSWQYVVGAILAGLLFLGYQTHISRIEKESFGKGFQEANGAWMVKGKQYVDMIEAGRAENGVLNGKLYVLSEEKRKLEAQKGDKVIEKQIEYVRSPDASKKGLDDKFVEIYNTSLGD